ncbi:hypothetical protein ACFQ88_04270 [Paenibacillus sp. NPDC056579]|uniref:hypothetical protein n=1 Tax=Paenibacillus sp. NPDC056579 TaxID=3345871 RepID=UPI0036CD7BCE
MLGASFPLSISSYQGSLRIGLAQERIYPPLLLPELPMPPLEPLEMLPEGLPDIVLEEEPEVLLPIELDEEPEALLVPAELDEEPEPLLLLGELEEVPLAPLLLSELEAPVPAELEEVDPLPPAAVELVPLPELEPLLVNEPVREEVLGFVVPLGFAVVALLPVESPPLFTEPPDGLEPAEEVPEPLATGGAGAIPFVSLPDCVALDLP